ncbi:dTMP kinase [Anaerotalea alkaliphila]|uniref:Thymidylate kinase n=1 Tax=Anaerotalea alkaliphila TaxID=2662126 RepID=A0A7X5HW50_9FIRM|nr:dTMP kinase [Anaerotalea alkaliphila]NDL67735.1 dTMP kinase [Anaerotalea alkaliphila]
MRGLFITLEGMDGSGKSTQINLLEAYFKSRGAEVVLTREPGGTVIGEEIRSMLLNREYAEMAETTEALLYAASRAQLVEEVVRPALAEGKMVICDRFLDSSLAYQGIARELGVERVVSINDFALEGLRPDLTIFLDLQAEEGLKRKKDQKDLDRMEMEKVDFHRKVSDAYRFLARQDSARILQLDASQDQEEIHKAIVERIRKTFTDGP